MTRIALLTAILCSSAARADFTFVAPGPLNAAGLFNNPGNSSFGQSNGDSFGTWGYLNFAGNVSPIVAGTQLGNLQFVIGSPLGGFGSIYPAAGGTFPANTPVVNGGSVFVYSRSGVYTFQAINNVFGSGPAPQAVWNSASFNFLNQNVATSLGTFGNNVPLSLDTMGSNFDTELGLYDSNGNLVATNDNVSGTNLTSLINSGFLAPGSYTLLAGGNDSQFDNGVSISGASAGNLLVNVNGGSVFAGAAPGQSFAVFQFDVSSTPAPAAVWIGLIGTAALLRLRRRFR